MIAQVKEHLSRLLVDDDDVTVWLDAAFREHMLLKVGKAKVRVNTGKKAVTRGGTDHFDLFMVYGLVPFFSHFAENVSPKLTFI